MLSYILVSVMTAAPTLGLVSRQSGVSKLEQLADLIDRYYIEDTDRTELEDAAASAMISATGDRWSYYIPAKDYAAHVETSENAYVGIGITITVAHDGSGLQVMEVNPGSSAEEAGIRVGDVITGIDGEDAAGIAFCGTFDIIKEKGGFL